MDRWKGRVALVTGGNIGIGEATALALVKHGMKVVICARNFAKLEECATEMNQVGPGSALPIKCDVSKEDEILAMFDEINKKYGGVDVLINNAGLAHNAPMVNGKTEDWRNMLEVNVLGVAICAREALSSMKKKGVDDGHIINISSTGGHSVLPLTGLHFYSATKFAVTAMTEALRNELKDMKSHTRVSQISPGGVHSDFISRLFGGTRDGVAEDPGAYHRLRSSDIADIVVLMLSAPPNVEMLDTIVKPLYQK